MVTGFSSIEERWGRFTVRGSAEVEAELHDMIVAIARTIAAALPKSAYRSVVLLGGYGRGEGGVEVRDGRERPHNNFDFLVIATDGQDCDELKRWTDAALKPLVDRYGIGMDVGVINEGKLRRAPCLVMWYDMRFGHKTLAGDPSFLPALTRFDLAGVLDWDVRNLMVNRGSLLVINDVVLARGDLNEHERRTVVKHVVKAIIGYGDAVLFFHGRYHFSYVEKQRRMRALSGVSERLRAAYDEAMEFRFAPDYGRFLRRDLAAWQVELSELLAPIHLACEAARLGRPGLRWNDYPALAFERSLADGLTSPRLLAERVIRGIRGQSSHGLMGARARLGYRTARPAERLAVVFPAVAFGLDAGAYAALAREVLAAPSDHHRALCAAYLKAWGRYCDPNFDAVLRTLRIDLDGQLRSSSQAVGEGAP